MRSVVDTLLALPLLALSLLLPLAVVSPTPGRAEQREAATRLLAAGLYLNRSAEAPEGPVGMAEWGWPPRSAALGPLPMPDTAVLRDMRRLPSLQLVMLRGIPIDADVARALADLPHVEQLNLRRCPFGPGAAAALAGGGPRSKGPPRLRTLIFEVTLPPPDHLRELGRLPGVSDVTLLGVAVPPGGLAPFYARGGAGPSFPALRWFDVSAFGIGRGGTTSPARRARNPGW
jgi:hypothetical protein